jgi:hypothetical protein
VTARDPAVADPESEHDRTVSTMVRIHLVLLAILAISVVGLIGGGCGGGDVLCPGPLLGIVLGAFGVLMAIALVIARATDRASPLVVIDSIVGAPLVVVPLVPLLGGSFTLAHLVALAALLLTIAGAVLAARIVATHRREQLVLTVALAVLVVLFMTVRSLTFGIILPIVLVLMLFTSDRRGGTLAAAAETGPPPSPPTL